MAMVKSLFGDIKQLMASRLFHEFVLFVIRTVVVAGGLQLTQLLGLINNDSLTLDSFRTWASTSATIIGMTVLSQVYQWIKDEVTGQHTVTP